MTMGPSWDPRENTSSSGPSPLSLWWHSLDGVLCTLLLTLIWVGVWLILAASPGVTAHHNWNTFVLLKRHLVLVVPGIILMLTTSLFSRRLMILGALMGGVGIWLLLWFVPYGGYEVKGARRWINLAGFSLQPSEFLKPALAIMTAWIVSHPLVRKPWNFFAALGVLCAAIAPLFLQPDIGMAFVLVAMTAIQCFVAGLPWLWVFGGLCVGTMGALGTYVCFPHTVYRISLFFQNDPTQDVFGGQYQSLQAVKSIAAGGIFGKGPGAGTLVDNLPDSHADFIFAVAGEEMGLLVCLAIIACYTFIVFRSLGKIFQEKDNFYALSILGLASQLMIQVFLNIGSVLRLIPTKGTTLPFISYGGSSFMALCWGMGMLLALTRRYRKG